MMMNVINVKASFPQAERVGNPSWRKIPGKPE
jgi:hypothetical protein